MIPGIERAAVYINQLCVRNYACWTGFGQKNLYLVCLYFVHNTEHLSENWLIQAMGGASAILTCIYSFAFMLYTLHSVSYILNILVITLQLRATSPRCYDGWEGMLLRSIMHLHYCRFYIIVDYNWKGDICWPELGNWSIWSGGVIISGIRCSSGQCQWTEEAGIGHRGQGNSYTDQYEIACEPSHHQRDKIHDYRLNDRMGGRGSQRCCSYSEPPLSC